MSREVERVSGEYSVLNIGQFFQLLKKFKQDKGELMSIIYRNRGIYDDFRNDDVSGMMAMDISKVEK